MSLYNDIRAALEVAVSAVSGIPATANRVFDGMEYSPVVGTAYMRCTFIPNTARARTLGPPVLEHLGLFQVSLYYPAGPTNRTAAETLADTIKSAFALDVTLSKNSTRVRIRYAERGQALVENGWVHIPITISWYVHSQSY